MAPSPKPRSNSPAITFWIAGTWTKRSSGPRGFRRRAKAAKAAWRFVRCQAFRRRPKPRPRRITPSPEMVDIRAAAEAVFRQESGRIIATLIRISGSFDRAEEAMQEAFAAALASWSERGIPQNPAAWITTAAHRKLIDQSRREKVRDEKQDSLRYEIENVTTSNSDESDEAFMHLPDDRLRLIFTCCHPALRPEAQVSLTLKTLCGLTTAEVAKAFL